MNEQVNHEITNCRDCGRPLTSAASRTNAANNGGRGPRCAEKHQRVLRVLERLRRTAVVRHQPVAEENAPANAGTDPAVTNG